MKGKGLRRLLSVFLTAAMLVSMLAVTAVTTYAAQENANYKVIIKNVTRKCKLAMDICNLINSRRTANGMAELAPDNTLFEQAMERAAQLSIRYNTTDLTENIYSLTEDNDGSRYETVLLTTYRLDGTTTATTILNRLENELYTSNNSTQKIGVGAVLVDKNPIVDQATEQYAGDRLFVCVRASVGTATAPDAETYAQENVTINQATAINHNVLDSAIEKPVIYNFETGNYQGTSVELEEGKSYQLLFKLVEMEADTDTCAYIIPTVDGGINDTETVMGIDFTPSALNYSSLSATKSFRVTQTDPTVTMSVVEMPNGSGYTYSKTADLKCTVTQHEPLFTAEDIELAWYEGVYDDDANNNKPAVLSVKDHYTGKELKLNDDYYIVAYWGCSTKPNSGEFAEAHVRIKGRGAYVNNSTITLDYKLYAPAEDYTVTLKQTTSSVHVGERLMVEAIAAKDSTFTFSCTDPDGQEVTGAAYSGYRFVIYPEKSGKYVFGVKAVDSTGTKLAQDELEVNVLTPPTATLTASEDNPSVGDTIALTAEVTGIEGALTYTFINSSGQVIYSGKNNTTEYTPTRPGSQKIYLDAENEAGDKVSTDLTITAREAEQKPTVVGYSLTLGGEIGINLYVNLPDNTVKGVLNGSKGEVTVNATDEGCFVSSGKMMGYYKFSYYVAASDYKKAISLQIINSDDTVSELYNANNERLENDTYMTSAADYLEYALNNETDAALKDLCESMYTYSAYAAQYFENEDLPDGLDINELGSVTAETLANYKSVKYGDIPDGLEITGYTLMLEDMTSLRLYYAYSGNGELVIKVNGSEGELGKSKYGKYACMRDIKSTLLGNPVNFSLSDGEKEIVVSISPLTYAYLVLNAYSDSNNSLCNTMRALYLYNQNALAYFSSGS